VESEEAGMQHHHQGHHDTSEMKHCIDACHECHWICSATIPHCLEMGGRHAEMRHLRLMIDCAEICALSAGLMSRGSDHHAELCRVCAEICRECAESCARMGDDAQMMRCAEICRHCAESCAEMAGRQAEATAALR
jgi:hypothetical protein